MSNTLELFNRSAERNTKILAGLAKLATNPSPKEVWSEWQEFQAACVKRQQELNEAVQKQFKVLAAERARLKKANTVSKKIEQECNLIAQFGQILNTAMVNEIGLLENIQVDFMYWLSSLEEDATATDTKKAKPDAGRPSVFWLDNLPGFGRKAG